jgi:monovalent cation:H+ antiporter-2, CPA2 family
VEPSACPHLEYINDVALDGRECPQCVELGDGWVHLRVCMTCGQVGCCDSSKNQHASKHAEQVGHPIVRSLEQGEFWMWCYVDDVLVST